MKLWFCNRQRTVPVYRERIASRLDACFERCRENPPEADPVLFHLRELHFFLVSNKVIAEIHEQFCKAPGSTDVITFPHGEVFLGAGEIRSNALDAGHPFERECLLCCIHAMLHLAGHDDLAEHPRAIMHHRQFEILEEIWPVS